MAKPIKSLELHYPKIQFLIISDIQVMEKHSRYSPVSGHVHQTLINTRLYRKEKLQENDDVINYRTCSNDQ